MTLTQRIKDIRLTLNRPYFYVSLSPDNQVKIVFESEKEEEKRFIFVGRSLADAVSQAERWIEHEKKMGSLKTQKDSEKKDEKTKPE